MSDAAIAVKLGRDPAIPDFDFGDWVEKVSISRSLRSARSSRLRMHGENAVRGYLGGASITLSGIIVGADESDVADQLTALAGALAMGPSRLWLYDDRYWPDAECVSFNYPEFDGQMVVPWTAQFSSPEPAAFAAAMSDDYQLASTLAYSEYLGVAVAARQYDSGGTFESWPLLRIEPTLGAAAAQPIYIINLRKNWLRNPSFELGWNVGLSAPEFWYVVGPGQVGLSRYRGCPLDDAGPSCVRIWHEEAQEYDTYVEQYLPVRGMAGQPCVASVYIRRSASDVGAELEMVELEADGTPNGSLAYTAVLDSGSTGINDWVRLTVGTEALDADTHIVTVKVKQLYDSVGYVYIDCAQLEHGGADESATAWADTPRKILVCTDDLAEHEILQIDMAKHRSWRGTSEDMIAYLSGDYWPLDPGWNALLFTSADMEDQVVGISIAWRKRYLY